MAHNRKIILLVLTVGWIITITVLSLMPPSGLPGIGFPHLDKIVHFVFYYVFFILCYYALSKETPPLSSLDNRAMVLSLTFAIVYGMIVEVLQYKMAYGRAGDVKDALANTTGVICGIFTVILIKAINKTTKRAN
ncbi:VanZ family protein [Sinomicrobium weinanense]|uniref:VanZ family protein n=1 Tax=Sinomicrobium weinanense TaxID=2842200 RepID=A0A926JPE5_9FLAO|nr:VanZ family protein [Sinomicrobium weinanense]MBC9795035.1 VanZ family protein [Sinomicrobium weinanense]MBU3123836.1 VanZ family protein [Sinomicrobium weinanense]